MRQSLTAIIDYPRIGRRSKMTRVSTTADSAFTNTDRVIMASAGGNPEDFVHLFKSIGLPQSKAAEAAKNPKSAAILRDLIDSHNLASVGLSEKRAVLVSALAVQLSKSQNVGPDERAYIVRAILEDKLKSVDQVNGRWSLDAGGSTIV